jgi:hypothetical protein
MSQEPVMIAIILEGGLVQQVLTAGVPVRVVTIDYDTDGDDTDWDVPQFDGETPTGHTVEAYVGKYDAEVNGPFVLAVHDLKSSTPDQFNEEALNIALARYDHSLTDYDEAVKEIEALGWTERRAMVILDEHIDA